MQEVEIQQKYNLIHELGYYVWLSTNNPKKFPTKPVTVIKEQSNKGAVRVMSDKEQDDLITIMQNSIKYKQNKGKEQPKGVGV